VPALLVLACVAIPSVAVGQVRIEVIETDPVSPAGLGHWQRFNVHFSYESDRPTRVYGEAYWRGRRVTAITSGSPLYPAGAGDGMFWFAYTEPAQVDRIVLSAHADGGRAAVAQAAVDVELVWTGERSAPPTPAAWVTRMDAEAARRQKEAYAAYMNRPTPAWETALFLALVWSPVGYAVAQVFALWRLRAGWRLAAAIPLVPMGAVVLYTIWAYSRGSNLFPLMLIFTSPLALLYLLVLIVAGRRLRAA